MPKSSPSKKRRRTVRVYHSFAKLEPQTQDKHIHLLTLILRRLLALEESNQRVRGRLSAPKPRRKPR